MKHTFKSPIIFGKVYEEQASGLCAIFVNGAENVAFIIIIYFLKPIFNRNKSNNVKILCLMPKPCQINQEESHLYQLQDHLSKQLFNCFSKIKKNSIFN
jgi:hypothetical protein